MTFSMRFKAPLMKRIFSVPLSTFVGVVLELCLSRGKHAHFCLIARYFSPALASLRVEENLWSRKLGDMSFRDENLGIQIFPRVDVDFKTSMQMGPQMGVEFETSRLK